MALCLNLMRKRATPIRYSLWTVVSIVKLSYMPQCQRRTLQPCWRCHRLNFFPERRQYPRMRAPAWILWTTVESRRHASTSQSLAHPECYTAQGSCGLCRGDNRSLRIWRLRSSLTPITRSQIRQIYTPFGARSLRRSHHIPSPSPLAYSNRSPLITHYYDEKQDLGQ